MSDRELDDFERHVARHLVEDAGPCPDEAQLLAFSHGKLSGEATETTVRHTDRCGSCQAFLLDERRIARVMSEVDGLSEDELPLVSDALRDRVLTAVGPGRTRDWIVAWWTWRVPMPAWALLACAATLVLLLYPAWHGLVRPRTSGAASAGLDQPFSDLQVLTLFGGLRSTASVLPEANASHRLILLQLGTLADLRDYQHFGAALRDGSGRIIWSSEDIKPAASFGGFVLAIPGSSLPTGTITATITGFEDGQEKLKERFEFAVTR